MAEHQHIDIIENTYPTLPMSEKKVADYIMENMSLVLRMSIRELKDAVGVSEPTVFRFCKALGFTGFKDFKISMAQQVSTYRNYFTSEDEKESKLKALIRRTLQMEVKIIDTTLRLIDYDQLEMLTEKIIEAQRICLFGAGTSVEVCNDARRKLLRLGLSVWSFNDFHEAVTMLGTFTKNDMLIAISHSGITKETGDVLHVAHERGSLTVLMTSSPNTPMRQYTDIILRTYAQESTRSRIAIASRVSQFALFDALYMALIANMGEETLIDMMEQTTKDVTGR